MNETDSNTSNQPGQGLSFSNGTNRLVRPVGDRAIAGVAVGLANFLGVPLWVMRTVFVVLTIAAGSGLALYLVGWLLIPDERDVQSIAEDLIARFRRGDRGWVGIALIVVALLILFDGWLGSRLIWAIGFGVVGYLLYTGHLNLGGSSGEPPPGSGGPESPPDPVVEREPHPDPETTDLGAPQDEPDIEDASAELEGAELEDSEFGPLHPAERMELEAFNNGPWDEGDSTDIEPEPPPSSHAVRPKKTHQRSHLGKLTLAVAIATVAVLGALVFLGLLPLAPGHLWAVALGLVGLGLLVGTFAGRARWLILVGILLTPVALAAPVGGFSVNAGEYSVSPTEFADLPAGTSREMMAGRIHYDLTDLPWDGETITLDLDLGAGLIELDIPEGVAVESDLRVSLGVIETEDRDEGGYDLAFSWDRPGTDGTVRLDARVGVGNLTVNTVPPSEPSVTSGMSR